MLPREGWEQQHIGGAAGRVGLGPEWVCQVGVGAERELASHPPVLSHLLSVVASVEVPQLLQQSCSQHVIHPLLQPLVQSWEEKSRTRSATWSCTLGRPNMSGHGSALPASRSTRGKQSPAGERSESSVTPTDAKGIAALFREEAGAGAGSQP